MENDQNRQEFYGGAERFSAGILSVFIFQTGFNTASIEIKGAQEKHEKIRIFRWKVL